MNFQLKLFLSSLPSDWKEIYQTLSEYSFVPTLVGGTVRDFLLTGKMGKDWDIELRHSSVAFNKDEWKGFGKKLSQFGKVSFLPYEIIRLDIKDEQFEFSPPRKEVFSGSRGHSNFIAEYDFQLPFEEAVLRRDFTINAMGVLFHSLSKVELLDPLGGLSHLRERCLHPASPDFSKDPVRFLRAIRFSLSGFSFSTDLKGMLEKMPLDGITANYLWSEMQKSKQPLEFLQKLAEWKKIRKELVLPMEGKDILAHGEVLKKVIEDETQHEAWIIALEWAGLSSESWQKYFSLSAETCQRMSRWARHSKKFKEISPEAFHGEFDKVRDEENFDLLFDWYFTTKQLLQKNPKLPLLKMIEDYLPEWIHLYRFEAPKDVKHIDPPLRAKYQVWNLCQRL